MMNLAKLIDEHIPAITPRGWRPVPNMPTGAIYYRHLSGLVIIYSLAIIEGGRRFHHISFSRQDRIPSWEEMRDALYDLPWLKKDQEVFMTLPPKEDYVNYCSFAMHWWQEIVN